MTEGYCSSHTTGRQASGKRYGVAAVPRAVKKCTINKIRGQGPREGVKGKKLATKRQKREEHNDEKKATTKQLKISEAAAFKSPRSGTQEGPQAARGRRHSKAMGAPTQDEVRTGVRLPANHDAIAGEADEQDVVLDLRVLCGTGRRVPIQHSAFSSIATGRPGKSKARHTAHVEHRRPGLYVSTSLF